MGATRGYTLAGALLEDAGRGLGAIAKSGFNSIKSGLTNFQKTGIPGQWLRFGESKSQTFGVKTKSVRWGVSYQYRRKI